MEGRELVLAQGNSPLPELLMWQFANDEEAQAALVSLRGAAVGSLARWGANIFSSSEASGGQDGNQSADPLEAPKAAERDARNAQQLSILDAQHTSQDARYFKALPELRVAFPSQEQMEKIKRAFEDIPKIETPLQPLADWMPGQKLTDEQLRLRRLLSTLLEQEDDRPWETPEVLAKYEGMSVDFSGFSEEEYRTYITEQRERDAELAKELRKLKLEWIDKGLQRSKGATKQLIEGYLKYDDFTNSRRGGASAVDDENKEPGLADFIAESLGALGFVETSSPEYRFAADLNAYVTFEENPPAGTEPKHELVIEIANAVDSVAIMSALADWLYQQGATSVEVHYERVVLDE